MLTLTDDPIAELEREMMVGPLAVREQWAAARRGGVHPVDIVVIAIRREREAHTTTLVTTTPDATRAAIVRELGIDGGIFDLSLGRSIAEVQRQGGTAFLLVFVHDDGKFTWTVSTGVSKSASAGKA